ncbi:MAG: methylated-DNA--[protein]-cysteine S-methyltransferase [Acidimicrobiia bacterium]|nr:methylated-DNA--[protein]-cysteine S-methyltransferase [Acidimicrobiia bacterium]
MSDPTRALARSARHPVTEAAAAAAERFVTVAEREGLADVAYATVESPVGPLLAAATPRGLVRLAFPGEAPDVVVGQLAALVSPRVLELPRRLDGARRELDEYFAGRRRAFDLPLDWSLVHGFGRAVLRATARIPYGSTSTYARVAARAGNPRAARATGNALGANPIPIVIPCHRVLRTGGALGGYGGGLPVKELLLELEGVHGVRRH